VNDPLANLEDRKHAHSLSTTVHLDTKSISAIGCCNPDGACNGDYQVTGKTTSEASGLPFAQLTFCALGNATADAVPYGTIAYFLPGAISKCSDVAGYAPLSTTTGRVMIPGYSTGLLASTASPLSSGQDPIHNHQYTATFETQDQSYAGVTGCCNDKLAEDKDYTVTSTTSSNSTGIPYIQLLTCVSQNPTFDVGLPDDAYLFTEVSCPPGWEISELLAGRFPLVLPESGTPGAIFGGASLPPSSTTGNNHTHSFNASFNTNDCEVGLASGCCGSGYVKNHQYITSGLTQQTESHFPYVEVPLCEKSV